MLYTAEPGTPSEEKLGLLASLGADREQAAKRLQLRLGDQRAHTSPRRAAQATA